MLKRTHLLLSALIVVSLVLAACGGAGSGGTIKIVSDLPMTGSSLGQTQTIVNAINMAFAETNNTACNGAWKIEYEAVDDASAALGKWDPEVVTANAKRYAADASIVGVIGTYNSGAAKLLIPITNPENLAVVSPANTYTGLTKQPAEEGEPEVYYPNGQRNYARVVTPDDVQGAVGAQWAKDLGASSVYILDDNELYGKGVADVFDSTAKTIGLNVLGHESIDPKAADYNALATKVKELKPDAVYFGMITQNNAGQVIKDLRNAGYEGLLVGPDGIQETALIEAAGQTSEGVYSTFAGVPPNAMTGKAAEWRDAYKAKFGADPEVYAVYGYVSAKLFVDALNRVCTAGGSPTDRKAVRDAIFATKDFDSVLGTFSINPQGDTTLIAMSGSVVKNGKWEFVSLLSTK
jgi:branched-chain amino acid transport system substrate-binding protein